MSKNLLSLFIANISTMFFSFCVPCYGQWVAQTRDGIGSFQSISFSDNNNGFVTGSRFQFSKTVNGGSTWVSQNANAGPEELSSVFMTSPKDIYLVIKAVSTGSLDQLFVSHDAGTNFIRNRYGVFHTVYFQDAVTGYLAGPNGTMLKTPDAGQNWSQLNTGTTHLITDVYFPASQTGFLVGTNGLLRKTNDGGTTWQALNPGTSTDLAAVYFTSPNVGYCVGSNGTALRTQNAGLAWTAMPIGVTVALHDIIFTSTNVGYIVGDFGTILSTIDGGTTWRPEVSNTFESLNALAAIPNGRVWAAGDNGTVLVHDPVITATTVSENEANVQLYPNPTNGPLTISLGPQTIGPVTISVINAKGQVILSNTYLSDGHSALSIPTERLVQGIYLVQITSATNNWTRRISKID